MDSLPKLNGDCGKILRAASLVCTDKESGLPFDCKRQISVDWMTNGTYQTARTTAYWEFANGLNLAFYGVNFWQVEAPAWMACTKPQELRALKKATALNSCLMEQMQNADRRGCAAKRTAEAASGQVLKMPYGMIQHFCASNF